ncbi:phenylalanine--tRNA ligase beta subunit [Anaeramoeba ignava]|uniref:phenylalanine--tRNA ligase n=1 Tax=Anaeramoeba ignava TaxID=1746090 RepID=A0A9Q0LM04_ANAIG|nr:phenylalanine--tRNA ligase beta subunit [Anaeramoeba ignava]
MPVVSVTRDSLFKELGKTFTQEEFADFCFEFGIELDDVIIENQDGNDVTIYKIDVPANRYDLLCLEGLSQALNCFLQRKKSPHFIKKPKLSENHVITVKEETKQIRPFIVSAVLKNIVFNEDRFQSFIDLQDKLHQNICRRRTLVAIGTHDLDTLTPPFTYEALKPEDIKFIPLNQTKEMNANELMEFYENDLKLKHFLHIIRDSPVYPVIYDSKRVVLSLPPIINGDHSKITLKYKNVFIECTATDITKAKIVLDTIIAMFSQYCEEPFSAHSVEVIHSDGITKTTFPELQYREVPIQISYINKVCGVKLTADQISTLLEKMMLEENKEKRKTIQKQDTIDHELTIIVPPTRSDILHPCDIAEDVAIAYGYNNIVPTTPKSNTIATQQPLNHLTELLRIEVSQCGFTEVLNFALSSHQDCFENMRMEDDGKTACVIQNPKTTDFQIPRISLIPGLLKTYTSSRDVKLPIKLFEISEIVVLDEKKETGAKNIRKLAALYVDSNRSGFESIHGLLDRVMQVLGIKWDSTQKDPNAYYLKETIHPSFFEKRCAQIYHGKTEIGIIGIVHPLVLKNFSILNPCSAIEIDIEHFLKK